MANLNLMGLMGNANRRVVECGGVAPRIGDARTEPSRPTWAPGATARAHAWYYIIPKYQVQSSFFHEKDLYHHHA